MHVKTFFKKKTALFVTVLSIGASGAITVTDTKANTVQSKPAAPEITAIRTRASKSKATGHVIINFVHPTSTNLADIVSVEVRAGKMKCNATTRKSRIRTHCTIRNVKIGKKLRIKLRAKNANGSGVWSKTVVYVPKLGNTWTNTPRLPESRTDTTRSRVLSTANVKLSKIEGLKNVASTSRSGVRTQALGDVVFYSGNVIALAQAEQSRQTGSKLLAVLSDGSLVDAIVSGTATVDEFYVAPNGEVFVVFESKVALTNGGVLCLLARIDASTGVPSCVDESLDRIKWNFGNTGGNTPIQFDRAGNIYYAGESASTTVLRKTSGNQIVDLINDNISLQDFVVLPDGTVLVAGETKSSNSRWLRRMSSAGGVKNLFLGTVQSLWTYSDGNVYAGLWSGDDFGIKRYLPSLDSLEARYWVSGNVNGVERSAYFTTSGQQVNISDCRGGLREANGAFCGWYGTLVAPMLNTITGTYGVTGTSSQKRQLWQYYPTVTKANVQRIVSISVAERAGNSILLAGTDGNNTNTLSLYEPAGNQETVVLDGSNEIEIYSMSYNNIRNSVLFTGLRFSDNRHVIGEVSLS